MWKKDFHAYRKTVERWLWICLLKLQRIKMTQPAFHFLMLAAGEVLKDNKYRINNPKTVSPQEVQTKIYEDEAFGVKVPLEDCELALKLLEDAGLLERYDSRRWAKST